MEDDEKDDEKSPEEPIMVVAPFTLPGGYVFEALVQGKTIAVTVPDGGCMEGDIIPIDLKEAIEKSKHSATRTAPAPSGEWRYGLFSCDNIWCSCVCLMAMFFPWILLAQLMQRMKLNPWGLRGSYKSTCKIVTTFMIITFIIQGSMLYIFLTSDEIGILYSLAAAVFSYGLVIIFFWNVCTRIQTRRRYHIPETFVPECYCDDCCIAIWCNCCSLIQISRHTHDENIHPYFCCSVNGLPKDTPDTV